MLLQRRMEILNQLETIVGKQQQQQAMSSQIKTVEDADYLSLHSIHIKKICNLKLY